MQPTATQARQRRMKPWQRKRERAPNPTMIALHHLGSVVLHRHNLPSQHWGRSPPHPSCLQAPVPLSEFSQQNLSERRCTLDRNVAVLTPNRIQDNPKPLPFRRSTRTSPACISRRSNRNRSVFLSALPNLVATLNPKRTSSSLQFTPLLLFPLMLLFTLILLFTLKLLRSVLNRRPLPTAICRVMVRLGHTHQIPQDVPVSTAPQKSHLVAPFGRFEGAKA
mmetsp:Transcript_44882/g.105819  ORF Transcript_44882/g.105819 Transcript_44882/m.105819 type:complete len:222 (-) Transcript_44882:198-863(-)